MAKFIGDHIGTILQLLVTAWFAAIARSFQITLAVYGTRLETTREAVRRSRVLWWLKKDDPNWTQIINDMMAWHAINEVYLTPDAAQALLDIYLWKTLQAQLPAREPMPRERFKDAQIGWDTLRRELLRFRKRSWGTMLKDGWRWASMRDPKRKGARPSVGSRSAVTIALWPER